MRRACLFAVAWLTTAGGLGAATPAPAAPSAHPAEPAHSPKSEKAVATKADSPKADSPKADAPKVDAAIGKYLSENRSRSAVKAASPTATPSPEDTTAKDFEGLTNPALRPPTPPRSDAANWKRREHEMQLEVGRQLRLKKEFPQAVVTLINLLESDAAEDVKRPALLEMGLAAQQAGQTLRAQQVLAQYVVRYPDDAKVPEVLLRQGLLHRELGAHTLALAKFYAVLSSALTLKLDRFPYYQRIVLQAQIEIADTFFLQGKHGEAAEYLARLMRLETEELDKARIQFKLVRAFHAQGKHDEAIGQGGDFLKRFADSPDVPEMRFLIARSYKTQGRTRESLREVMLLMESQPPSSSQTNAMALAYWQQRAGNDIANQLYQEGDYLSALQVYEGLAQLDRSPQWQLPAWYQIGLVYERLRQPAKAAESFAQILGREKELDATASPALKTVVEMARWRQDYLRWQLRAESAVPLPPPPLITNSPPKTASRTGSTAKK